MSNTFTVSGLSFQPKVLFLWHNGQDDATDTLTSTDHRRGWGFAAGTAARGCIGTIARDASAASNTGVAQRNDGVICVPTDAGAIDGVIDLSAFNSDGFTLIVDDATAAALALDVEWVAWGGSDITNATSAQIQTPAAAGNWDTTTVGFQPTFLALLGTAFTSAPPAANVDTRMCFGCTDGTDQWVWSGGANDAANTMQSVRYFKTGEIYGGPNSAVTGFSNRQAFVSFLSNGFRLNQTGTTAVYMQYLAVAAGTDQLQVGSTTTRTDTTGWSVTIGHSPIAVAFWSHGTAESTAGTMQDHDMWSAGWATSTSARAARAVVDVDALADSEISVAVEYDAVYINLETDSAPAVQGLMDVTSFDTNGVSLVMDDADPSAAIVGYFSIGTTATDTPVTGTDSATESEALTALQANVTRTDSATLSEAILETVAWNTTDTTTVSEAATSSAALTQSDSATASEALTSLTADAVTTDSATASEALAWTVAWTATDSATISETSAPQADVGVVDSGTLTESGVATMGSDLAGTDSAVAAEALTSLTADTATTDSATATDALVWAVAWSPTDGVTLTDTPATHADVTAADSLTLTEVGLAEMGVSAIADTDSATVTEALTSLTLTLSPTDSTTLSDTPALHADVVAADNLTLTEVGLAEMGVTAITGTDTVTVSEALTALEAATVAVDTTTVTDALTWNVDWAVADSATVTDTESVSSTGGSFVTASDTATVSDALSLTAAWQLADTPTVSDLALIDATGTRDDTLGLTDAVTGLHFDVVASDSLTVTEAIATIPLQLIAADAAAIADTLAWAVQWAVGDTLTLTETGSASSAQYTGILRATASLSMAVAGRLTTAPSVTAQVEGTSHLEPCLVGEADL